jgi:hypothetical protein
MLAVDAIFFAFDELVRDKRPLKHPLEMMGAKDQPASLAEFTRGEIDEASHFLERIGVLGSRARRKRGAA